MNKNELLAYAVVFILATIIVYGLTSLEYKPEPAQATIPIEYRETYREAKERYQEWMTYPSWTRQDEIRDWCYESFDVPLPVVRRVDPFLAGWVETCREEYMARNKIWEIDELRRVK